MNWNNILENAIGNALFDIVKCILVILFISKYFEIVSEFKKNYGALIVFDSEIQVNKS